MNLVPKEDAKVGAGYGDVLQKDGPVEFLNGTGAVCRLIFLFLRSKILKCCVFTMKKLILHNFFLSNIVY